MPNVLQGLNARDNALVRQIYASDDAGAQAAIASELGTTPVAIVLELSATPAPRPVPADNPVPVLPSRQNQYPPTVSERYAAPVAGGEYWTYNPPANAPTPAPDAGTFSSGSVRRQVTPPMTQYNSVSPYGNQPQYTPQPEGFSELPAPPAPTRFTARGLDMGERKVTPQMYAKGLSDAEKKTLFEEGKRIKKQIDDAPTYQNREAVKRSLDDRQNLALQYYMESDGALRTAIDAPQKAVDAVVGGIGTAARMSGENKAAAAQKRIDDYEGDALLIGAEVARKIKTPEDLKDFSPQDVAAYKVYLDYEYDKKRGDPIARAKKDVSAGRRRIDYATALTEAAQKSDPMYQRQDRMEKGIANLEKRSPGFAQSWKLGKYGVAVDELVADALMSGDRRRFEEALEMQRQVQGLTDEDIKKHPGMVDGILHSAARMLQPMGKSMALSSMGAIPYAGAVLGPLGKVMSTSMWAKQGVGQMAGEIVREGGDPAEMLPMLMAVGVAYAAVENMQVGQVFNLGKRAAAGASKRAIPVVMRLLKEKTKDFAGEVTEEMIQEIMTSETVRVAVTGETPGLNAETGKRVAKTAWETAKETAGPMGVLSILGLGGGLAKSAPDIRAAETGVKDYRATLDREFKGADGQIDIGKLDAVAEQLDKALTDGRQLNPDAVNEFAKYYSRFT